MSSRASLNIETPSTIARGRNVVMGLLVSHNPCVDRYAGARFGSSNRSYWHSCMLDFIQWLWHAPHCVMHAACISSHPLLSACWVTHLTGLRDVQEIAATRVKYTFAMRL